MAKRISRSLLASILLCLASPLVMAQGPSKEAAAQAADAAPFFAEKKVAIVVGISDYPAESGFPKLQYAAKDAQDLASALEKQGYQTQVLTDQHAMKSSIRKALQQAHDVLNQGRVGDKESGTFLFAFSGHGGQRGTGLGARQYLVTYDSTADDAEPGYPLKEIAQALNGAGAAHKMMFIDACRDLTASSSKGAPALSSFRELMQAEGTKIFFSTAPGQQSFEDAKEKNGYFTHYLLEGLNGKAASPDGLVTFDSLAKWVSAALKADPNVDQVPYWNQNASGDFYVAGHLINKEALVIGIDQYSDRPLHSAIAGAKEVDKQLDRDGFDTTFLENATFSELEARLGKFAKNIGPKDVAVFYFAGEGGIASGKPFLMAADAKLPDQAVSGKWEQPPANSVTLAEVMDIVHQNHPGPNIFLLDMGLARASSADGLDLASLRREHTLVLFSCKSGQDPARTEEGSLFSRAVASVLREPNMSAGYAASKIMSAIYDQTNGVEYAVEIPMLPDRVYLTPSQ
jgi:uncharacterized caspase-like protein